MPKKILAQPKIVSRKKWLEARKKHLREEKVLTKHHDRVTAARRRLPMTPVKAPYVFQGPKGKVSLADLFEGNRLLIVYHFMFDPEWTEGCPGCTGYVDALGDLSPLAERKARFVLISHAPLAKLRAYKKRKGWTVPWYSSFGSEFNYDFHATLDEAVAPVEYNYRTKAQIVAAGLHNAEGEAHGLSVFLKNGRDVFHTYSTYARGVEHLVDVNSLLEATPFGRQQDWEDSPKGWPQMPTYG